MEVPAEEAAVNRIQVVVRVRPVLPHELSEPVAVTCAADGTKVQVALPDKETSKPALAANSRPDAKAYSFDACLTGSTTQGQLFDICGMDELVEAAVDGYSITVFAFGQTGSGKTYSIIGPSLAGFHEAAWADSGSQSPIPATPEGLQPDGQQQFQHSGSNNSSRSAAVPPKLGEDDGLLSRCVMQLYSCIEERKQETSCKVVVSCCEIYNEAVTDLLGKNKNQQLQVRQDSNEGFYVEGLTQKDIQSSNRALQTMSDALMYRHTRAHRLNLHSSRSHCLITFTIASQELQRGVKRVGKLVLVDLAGSERLKDTGNSVKEAVRETGSINKSLFTLGQVLAALSVRSGCGITGHVPYRDSKLTQLLWDGLKGGGRALMLACLSPLKLHADETLNTLHFASMALRIKSQPIIMMDPQDQMVLEMRDTIKALQDDCRSLAAAITQMSTGADPSSVLQALPPTLVQDALRYGSNSAPTSEMVRRQSPSRNASGGKSAKASRSAVGLIKPSTADPVLRHSLPALYTSSSPTKDQSSPSRTRQRQSPSNWNNSTSLNSIGLGAYYSAQVSAPGQLTASNNSNRNSWPAFGSPSRSGVSSPQRSSKGQGQSAGTSGGFPQAYAGSPSGGSSNIGSPVYASGSPNKAVWTGVSKYPGLAAREYALGAGAGIPGVGANHQLAQVSSANPGVANPMGQGGFGNFPELAALEQQFQQQFAVPQQQQHQGPAAGLQRGPSLIAQPGGPLQEFAAIGTNEVLVASGLPASIQAPQTLVPVRLGVTDTQTVGTSPDASPVAVALAAVENQVRPIAVPIPPTVTATQRASATAGSADGTAGSVGGVVGEQQQQEAAVATEPEQPPAPEPKALGWAERNLWFGADMDMTQLAYQVHDALVEQGVDPASDTYYAAIETKVAEQLPEKWAQWQAIMAAAAGTTTLGKSKQQPQQQQPSSPSNYTSFRMSLKSPVPKLSAVATGSPPQKRNSALEPSSVRQQQQQQQQPLWLPSGVADRGSPTAAVTPLAHQQHQQQQQMRPAPTLSVLLQAPRVSTSTVFNPQLQQQKAGASAQLPGKGFAEQLLQLYQQHDPSKAGAQALQQQLQQQEQGRGLASNQLDAQQPTQLLQQQQEAAAPASPSASLPELRQTASPMPPSPAAAAAAAIQPYRPHPGYGSSAAPGQLKHNSATPAVNPLVSQGFGQSGSRLGGVTSAANQVLASSQPSYYNGAGPLTTGGKQNWNMTKSARNINAGSNLAEVLRSGMSPGNKSLTDLQADYRAARALVLDQLRRQKEETEQQRKRILLQIGRAINSSRWQT